MLIILIHKLIIQKLQNCRYSNYKYFSNYIEIKWNGRNLSETNLIYLGRYSTDYITTF